MSETVVDAPAVAPKVEGRPDAVVLTQENFKEYVDEKLGVTPSEDAPDAEADPEAAAATEFAEQEKAKAEEATKAAEPKEGDVDGSKVYFKGKWVGKHDFQYRLHVQTEAKTKEAEAKIAAAAQEAKEAREAKEAADKRIAELKAKYEPDPPAELGPEPDPKDYGAEDMDKFRADLKKWSAENTKREIASENEKAAKAKQAEATAKAWKERAEAAAKEMPDFQETIAGSSVSLSDQARDAIIESDVGPKLLYHFAKNPDQAEALGKMTVGRMLREIGRLEAEIGGAAKPQSKSAEKVVEISKAPAPITPLKGGNAITGLKIDSKGEWTGTYEEFKAADRAGKFK